MKKIFIVLIIFGNAWNIHAVENLVLSDLVGAVFETIIADGDNLRLQFRDHGIRFFYSINAGSKKHSNYNEVIFVPIGSTLEMYSRNMRISFLALPVEIQSNGFSVHMTQDHRSGRGNLEEKAGFLLFQDKLGNDNSSLQKSNGIILTNASEETVRALISSKIQPAND